MKFTLTPICIIKKCNSCGNTSHSGGYILVRILFLLLTRSLHYTSYYMLKYSYLLCEHVLKNFTFFDFYLRNKSVLDL